MFCGNVRKALYLEFYRDYRYLCNLSSSLPHVDFFFGKLVVLQSKRSLIFVNVIPAITKCPGGTVGKIQSETDFSEMNIYTY